MSVNANLAVWHEHLKTKSHDDLLNQIADDAVFHSPVVHTPQVGKQLVFAYLSAADQVFDGANFTYVDEIIDDAGNKAMLEFTAEIDGIHINGIDIIHWNDDGKIQSFKVLVRPMKAMNMLWEKMGAMLETIGG
ncbi:hypothetical protein MNBD_ALPHA04-2345 [hydrothermal vent metagenome]|uniref:SnoaL-like domain-containing protein n=1 Tax=hydrothermal vent metagenome TaxID=652676 RepID=A0A3B0S976_9ZZZZ